MLTLCSSLTATSSSLALTQSLSLLASSTSPPSSPENHRHSHCQFHCHSQTHHHPRSLSDLNLILTSSWYLGEDGESLPKLFLQVGARSKALQLPDQCCNWNCTTLHVILIIITLIAMIITITWNCPLTMMATLFHRHHHHHHHSHHHHHHHLELSIDHDGEPVAQRLTLFHAVAGQHHGLTVSLDSSC